jgi:hypothetical protein
MTRSDDQATHSGFAQFPDHSARDRFVRSTLDPDSELTVVSYCYCTPGEPWFSI